MSVRQRLACVALAALACAATGCVGQVAMVAPQPLRQGAVVDAGPAQGSACGFLLLGVIPISINDRVSRAYEQALTAANAGAVTDTSVQERWYFALIGTVLCSDLSGRAVRYAQNDQAPAPR